MDKPLTIFGEVEESAQQQIRNVLEDERAVSGALMADGHLGYSMPIGGVVAYEDAISPSGVGFDIACGNKAVRTNLNVRDFAISDTALLYFHGLIEGPDPQREIINTFKPFMRLIQKQVAFGIGRSANEKADDPVMDDSSTWSEIKRQFGRGLRDKAADQLGTVGSGNHYVDLLVDEEDGQIWIANHFGSRGLGHTIASGFMAAAAGRAFTDRIAESEQAVVLDTTTDLGQFYIAAMHLAGKYAYAGRDYVAEQVLRILGAEETFSVHNHHNFAWYEDGKWVVRKGATPLVSEPAFIGGSMGDVSVIVRGRWSGAQVDPDVLVGSSYRVEEIGALGSAPHGAGRTMSRTQAAGKMRKIWVCHNRNCESEGRTFGRGPKPEGAKEGKYCPNCGILLRKMRLRDTSTAKIDWPMVRYSLGQRGIVVLGAGADEAPGVYKNLTDVLGAHSNIEILHRLRPLGVVMAGPDERDPYKD